MNASLRAGLEAALTRAWQARGPLACALWPLSRVYGALVALRRIGYRAGLRPSRRLPRPLIVVGNRIAGGAGKTPTVLALLAHLRARGLTPGVVARGHGARRAGVRAVQPDADAAEVGDEPLLIRLRGAVPVCVGRDRAAAAEALIAAHPELDVLVADDGLQHLGLARDLELLVFDARGAGNGWLLPAGPLREPLHAPSMATEPPLVLYNAGVPSTPLPGFLAQRRLAGAVALADWWRGAPARPEALQALRGRRLIACCGLAQPQRFFAALADAGLAVTPLALPDHAGYASLPWPADAADVIVTEKDAVKLRPARVAGERPATRVWVAPLDFRPEPALWAALDAALAAPLAAHRGRAWTPD